jgi:hypothetical protein
MYRPHQANRKEGRNHVSPAPGEPQGGPQPCIARTRRTARRAATMYRPNQANHSSAVKMAATMYRPPGPTVRALYL